MSISNLIAGHERFQSQVAERQDLYAQFARGQKPQVLWIGCCDSRVIPENIVQAQPGELFVLRVIANLVPPYGVASDTVGAVVEYAAIHLAVSDIVICGHTDCAGIKALSIQLNQAHAPHLVRWVEWARPALAQVEASGVAEEQRLLGAIKANVVLQCQNLLTYPCVRERVARGDLSIHAWLYDVSTGHVQTIDGNPPAWRQL